MQQDDGVVVRLEAVDKQYRLGRVHVKALDQVNLSIDRGEFLAFAGPSGSGKTTLLNLIGCVAMPSAGRVVVAGQQTTGLSDRKLTRLRLFTLGFVFQTFNLIPVLTAAQNVEFPLLLQRRHGRAERRRRVHQLLDRVGLGEHLSRRPGELSGGQRQRVAIARALVTGPKIVLADEPTANLDSSTGGEIIELMRDLNEREQTTFILSTHDREVMERVNRVVELVDGRVSG